MYCRAFEILLMVGLPGKTFKANPTATGHVPVYKANGMFCYLVTLATLCLLINTDRYRLDLFLSCFVSGGREGGWVRGCCRERGMNREAVGASIGSFCRVLFWGGGGKRGWGWLSGKIIKREAGRARGGGGGRCCYC